MIPSTLQSRPFGFTLLELTVALAIFAVLSTLAYGGLRQVLEARRETERVAERLAALQGALRQMELDLEQAAPRPIRDERGDLQGPLVASAVGDLSLELTSASWRNPAGLPRSTLRRVGYRVKNGVLFRYAWAVLDRSTDSQPLAEVLLTDVHQFELRFLDREREWQREWPPARPGDGQRPGAAARGRGDPRAGRLGGRPASVSSPGRPSPRLGYADGRGLPGMTVGRLQWLDSGTPSGTLVSVATGAPHRSSAASQGSLASAWVVPGRGQGAHRARGVALLTVMLVLSIAAVAAVAMAVREQVAIRRTANLLGAEQAYRYALGVEGHFIGILDSERDALGVDGPTSAWAKPFGPVDLGEARVEGYVEDLQGRFNVNNLLTDGQPSALDVERFDRLLRVLDVPREVRQALLDWLDPDNEPHFPGGAEDEAYLRATPARRAANGPMVSASELLLLAGVGTETYERLAPYVVALPERTAVNLNTAPAAVLMALVKDLGEHDAKAFMETRAKEPFAHVDEALGHQALAGIEANPEGLAVGSRWFRVHGRAESGSGRAELLTVVARPESGAPLVWMRERGSR